MIRTLILFFIVAVMVGCSGGGNDAVQNAFISSASYKICQDNPDAIGAIKVVCEAPDADLGAELAKLYAKYNTAIEDPFLRMQADILITAFMEEYDINIADPDFDFSILSGEEIRPFVDAICVGAEAAEAAR